MPMMSQRPGSFDVVLSERRFGNKFDFFGLPREIRDNIYCIIFGLETFPSVFTDLEGNLEHTENFRYKRPIHPIRFLARLNKTAPSAGCGIAFINQQSLQETTLVLLRSKRFHVSGDKQAISLLESMSSYGRSMWIHPLVLNLNNWETNAERAGQWMRIIYRSMHHRFRGLFIKIGDNGWKIDKYADIMSTPLARLLTARDKLGYRRVEFVPKLGGKEEKNFLWAFFCTIGCLHGELEEANLVKKVYEALERAAKNKQA
ncbi:hypothetical protein HDK90DRAFT_492617 [Phyllosticta capitalensis]|uniref:Uncharacterized protein n=2 Tax=Phyllosticta capitalensis TaxID=121624 RepID=A0ABR1YH10_9PEZI